MRKKKSVAKCPEIAKKENNEKANGKQKGENRCSTSSRAAIRLMFNCAPVSFRRISTETIRLEFHLFGQPHIEFSDTIFKFGILLKLFRRVNIILTTREK